MNTATAVTCPYCGYASEASLLERSGLFAIGRAPDEEIRRYVRTGEVSFMQVTGKPLLFRGEQVVCETLRCSNIKCQRESLWVHFMDEEGEPEEAQVVPRVSVRPWPGKVPTYARADYEEACLVLNDSPNAAAALARRCMQGMIRDFWKDEVPGLKDKGNLYKEIKSIEGKVKPQIYEALLAVKDVGNDAVHPNEDRGELADLVGEHPGEIVNVTPEAARKLVRTLEILAEHWYEAREREEELLAEVAEEGKHSKEAGDDGATS